jgi:hypothetical protein
MKILAIILSLLAVNAFADTVQYNYNPQEVTGGDDSGQDEGQGCPDEGEDDGQYNLYGEEDCPDQGEDQDGDQGEDQG